MGFIREALEGLPERGERVDHRRAVLSAAMRDHLSRLAADGRAVAAYRAAAALAIWPELELGSEVLVDHSADVETPEAWAKTATVLEVAGPTTPTPRPRVRVQFGAKAPEWILVARLALCRPVAQ